MPMSPKIYLKTKEQLHSGTTSNDHLILLPSLLASAAIIIIAIMILTLLLKQLVIIILSLEATITTATEAAIIMEWQQYLVNAIMIIRQSSFWQKLTTLSFCLSPKKLSVTWVRYQMRHQSIVSKGCEICSGTVLYTKPQGSLFPNVLLKQFFFLSILNISFINQRYLDISKETCMFPTMKMSKSVFL